MKTTNREKIRQFLHHQGITQAALADAYGCNRQYINDVLNERTPMPDIEKILVALSKLNGGVSYTLELTVSGGKVKDRIISLSTITASE